MAEKAKAKKTVAKKAAPKAARKEIVATAKSVEKKLVGEIIHFFDKISVAVVQIKDTIKVGDKISIEGPQTNFEMKIDSMQVEHKPLQQAKKGDDIGMKTPKPVRAKDLVYKV